MTTTVNPAETAEMWVDRIIKQLDRLPPHEAFEVALQVGNIFRTAMSKAARARRKAGIQLRKDYTLEELGEMFSLSPQRIAQILEGK